MKIVKISYSAEMSQKNAELLAFFIVMSIVKISYSAELSMKSFLLPRDHLSIIGYLEMRNSAETVFFNDKIFLFNFDTQRFSLIL